MNSAYSVIFGGNNAQVGNGNNSKYSVIGTGDNVKILGNADYSMIASGLNVTNNGNNSFTGTSRNSTQGTLGFSTVLNSNESQLIEKLFKL